jgi:hypothetical protein
MISSHPRNITETIVITTAKPIAIIPMITSAIPITRNHVERLRTSSIPVLSTSGVMVLSAMTRSATKMKKAGCPPEVPGPLSACAC